MQNAYTGKNFSGMLLNSQNWGCGEQMFHLKVTAAPASLTPEGVTLKNSFVAYCVAL